MSGALRKLPGIGTIEIEQGKKDFTVAYDSTKVKVDEMLAALKAAGEPAKVKS